MTKLKTLIKEINDKKNNLVLSESSLSRVWRHVTKHESGTISAFRGFEGCGDDDSKPVTKSQNRKNNSILKKKLLSMGYGVTKINGVYIENYKTPNAVRVREESFLVVDLKDKGRLEKDLVKLGQEFNQDSITFSKPNGDYYLVSSNTCPDGFPGNGKIGVRMKLGKPLFGKDGEFYSTVNGRPFVFENMNPSMNTIKNYSISEIRSIKKVGKRIKL